MKTTPVLPSQNPNPILAANSVAATERTGRNDARAAVSLAPTGGEKGARRAGEGAALRSLRSLAVILLTAALCSLASALGQPTTFTYQGRLVESGQPASGLFDLRFTLHDALAGGNSVAGPVNAYATTVSKGLFTAALDFGPGTFDGSARLLFLKRFQRTMRKYFAASVAVVVTRKPSGVCVITALVSVTQLPGNAVEVWSLNSPGSAPKAETKSTVT